MRLQRPGRAVLAEDVLDVPLSSCWGFLFGFGELYPKDSHGAVP